MLSLCAPGVKGCCLFSVHPKLPSGCVLLGRNLGDVFVKLLNKAKTDPKSVMVITRARVKMSEEAEKLDSIKHAVEGAVPVSLDSIEENIQDCSDGVSVDVSNLLPNRNSADEVEVVTGLSDNSVSNDVSVNDVSPSDISVPAENSVPVTSVPVNSLKVCIPNIKFNGVSKDEFVKMQKDDISLSDMWKWASMREKRCFVVEDVLMCLTCTHGRTSHAVLVPEPLRKAVLVLAHEGSGHFGIGATRALINSNFTWPGLNKDVKSHVRSCAKCQCFNKSGPPKAPLCPPEAIVNHFDKIAVDIVGPLTKSRSAFRFLLTAMDLATGFPFAYPMRGYTAEETARNMLSIFSVIGSPAAVLSDQGSNFMSKVLESVYSKFAVARVRTSPYHPESNGKLERFHASLKAVLRKCITEKKDWPLVLDLVLYFLRNLPHSRHGHTPYELTFLKPTPHILSTLKSNWSISDGCSLNVPSFISDLDSHISLVLQSLKDMLKDDIVAKRAVKDSRSLRALHVGQCVMMRVPGLNACLEASWEGPFVVLEKISDVNYKIAHTGRKSKSKIVHINMLKVVNNDFNELSVVAVCDDEDECGFDNVIGQCVPVLSEECQSSLKVVLAKHGGVFTNKPGKTDSVAHGIQVTCDMPVWSPSYIIPAHIEDGFRKSLDELLDLDIIEPSMSKWSSPPIPILKKDGDVRIVVDYRKLNQVTVPEPFHMPTVDEIISRLGNALFLSKLYLLKGFDQVPIWSLHLDSLRHFRANLANSNIK